MALTGNLMTGQQAGLLTAQANLTGQQARNVNQNRKKTQAELAEWQSPEATKNRSDKASSDLEKTQVEIKDLQNKLDEYKANETLRGKTREIDEAVAQEKLDNIDKYTQSSLEQWVSKGNIESNKATISNIETGVAQVGNIQTQADLDAFIASGAHKSSPLWDKMHEGATIKQFHRLKDGWQRGLPGMAEKVFAAEQEIKKARIEAEAATASTVAVAQEKEAKIVAKHAAGAKVSLSEGMTMGVIDSDFYARQAIGAINPALTATKDEETLKLVASDAVKQAVSVYANEHQAYSLQYARYLVALESTSIQDTPMPPPPTPYTTVLDNAIRDGMLNLDAKDKAESLFHPAEEAVTRTLNDMESNPTIRDSDAWRALSPKDRRVAAYEQAKSDRENAVQANSYGGQ